MTMTTASDGDAPPSLTSAPASSATAPTLAGTATPIAHDESTEVSALVKRAASLSKTTPKTTSSGKAEGAADGAGEPTDEPSRKRARADETTETDEVGKTNMSNIDNNQQFASLPFYGDHKRAISSLSFAPSSACMSRGNNGCLSLNSNYGHSPVLCASSSADGVAKVWDITKNLMESRNNATDIPTKKRPVGSAAAAAAATQSSFPAAATRLDPKLNLFGHNRGINDVAFSPTALYIATASDDKTLRLWSAETGDAFVDFKGHTNFVFSCKFNPQSNLLVSGSFDETVKLWDVRCGECVATLPAHSNPVTGVDFNRDGTCIVSGSYDGLVRIWDTATGECLKTVYAEGNPPVGCVRFSPNGKYVLSGTLDSKLRLYDVSGGRERGAFGTEHRGLHNSRPQPRGGKCSKTYAGHKNSKFCAFAAFLSGNPKRQCIVSGSEDGKVYLYDLQSRIITQTLEGHQDSVLAVDAHDSLELIGTGGMANDKIVRFWAPPTV